MSASVGLSLTNKTSDKLTYYVRTLQTWRQREAEEWEKDEDKNKDGDVHGVPFGPLWRTM